MRAKLKEAEEQLQKKAEGKKEEPAKGEDKPAGSNVGLIIAIVVIVVVVIVVVVIIIVVVTGSNKPDEDEETDESGEESSSEDEDAKPDTETEEWTLTFKH